MMNTPIGDKLFQDILHRVAVSQNSDQGRRQIGGRKKNIKTLESGPMPNVMAALPNIDGALCLTPQFG